jgi:phospho-N-acetylmuramoyl-pentapeptide-transferase
VKALLLAGSLGLIGTLLGTRWAISILTRRGYGQLIRDDGPTSHHTKRGTPTMGGLVIMVAVVFAYFAAKLILGETPSASALLLLFLFVGLGAVGFLDDYIKISKQRSLGLRSGAKFGGQLLVALVFGWLSLQFPDSRGNSPASPAISFIRAVDWKMPTALVLIWVLLIIAGTSNAVNLTDGLDGLAAGSSMMVFGAYTLVGIWQNNQFCEITPGPQ